jgi:hypothetical protein
VCFGGLELDNLGQGVSGFLLCARSLKPCGDGRGSVAAAGPAVVIAIRSSQYAMDVLLRRLRGVRSKLPQVGRLLVIKFDQDHWTVHAVIKRAIRLRATDPSEPSLVEIAVHLVHLHAGVAFVHVLYIEVN